MLIPFLKAVVDPDDPVSLVAYLRGPLCGVDDDALYRFKRDGGRFSYLSNAPSGTDQKILGAFEMLREARESSQHLPPAAALSRIMERLGLIAYAASRDRRHPQWQLAQSPNDGQISVG
jgi:ATP-dependent helicase/nuclease subunit A